MLQYCYVITFQHGIMKKLLILALVLGVGATLFWKPSAPTHDTLSISGPFEFNSQDRTTRSLFLARLNSTVRICRKTGLYSPVYKWWNLWLASTMTPNLTRCGAKLATK